MSPTLRAVLTDFDAGASRKADNCLHAGINLSGIDRHTADCRLFGHAAGVDFSLGNLEDGRYISTNVSRIGVFLSMAQPAGHKIEKPPPHTPATQLFEGRVSR